MTLQAHHSSLRSSIQRPASIIPCFAIKCAKERLHARLRLFREQQSTPAQAAAAALQQRRQQWIRSSLAASAAEQPEQYTCSSSGSSSSSSIDVVVTGLTGPPTADDRPLHPAALRCLNFLYLGSCTVERSWRFLFPIALIAISPSDAVWVISLLSVSSSLATGLLGPTVGGLLDRVWRPFGLAALLLLQDLSIAAMAAALATSAPGVPLAAQQGRLAVVLVAACVEKLSAIVSELEIERDWVSRLTGKANVVSLATANGWIRRMDLATELLSAFALGWLISRVGMPPSLAAMATVALAMAPLQLAAIFRIAQLAPQAMLHGREEIGVALVKPPDWRTFVRRVGQWQRRPRPRRPPLRARLQESAAALLGSWRIYFSQPILPSSMAFVLLFGNVMLSPGNLIVALLDSHGFNNSAHACFRAGCATMGFVGTWLARRLIRSLGLLRAGCLALLLQLATLGAAAAIFAACMQPAALLISGGRATATAGPTLGGVPLAAAAFAACVVLSRAGAWVMDLVNSQLFQQTVPQREMASASSAEMALCATSESAMLALAASSASSASYPHLVYGSLAAVALAAVVFTHWAQRAQPSIDLAMQAAA